MKIRDIMLEGSSSYTLYPLVLKDEYEIADYIETQSSDHVDRGMIEDYFKGAYAELETVSVSSIEEGDEDHNIRDEDKEQTYSTMDVSTMPPIVIEGGKVVDGNHRFRVVRSKGLKTIQAYVVKD